MNISAKHSGLIGVIATLRAGCGEYLIHFDAAAGVLVNQPASAAEKIEAKSPTP